MPFSKNYYAILEKRWPHALQVLSIYLWSAAAVAMGVLFFWKIEPFLKERAPWLAQGWVEPLLFAVLLGVPIGAGVLLRHLLRTQGKLKPAATAQESRLF